MLDWIQSTSYAVWVRESWGWPFALTLHAFGNAIVVGLVFIICLRVLGLSPPLARLPAPFIYDGRDAGGGSAVAPQPCVLP